MDKQILELLESNAKLTADEIAAMLNKDPGEVREAVDRLEKSKAIVKYVTIVDWEKAGEDQVTALIEVRVTPKRDVGFESVAERIYRFPEVISCRLMSGAYDLVVFVQGRTLREVSHFVATKLATIDGVISTATHFVLRTYKQSGVIFTSHDEDRRQAVVP